MPDGAMQFFNDYGWIHWDGHTETWHTVTGYELGKSEKAPQTRHPVLVAQAVRQLPGLDLNDLRQILQDVAKQEPGAGAAPADGAPADAVPADGAPADAVPADGAPADAVPAEAPADGAPADAVPADGAPADAVPAEAPADVVPADAAIQAAAVQAAAAQAAADDAHRAAAEAANAVAETAKIERAVAAAAAAVEAAAAKVEAARKAAAQAATAQAAQAAVIPAAPAQKTTASDQGTTWDTEHKRDEDRADTQHTLENTRWDSQHTLDNARWDTRHTLENTRWDSQHTLDNARWDTRHTLENTRWDSQHTLDNARWDTRHTLENTRWDSQHTLDNARWDTRHTLDNARWDTYLALKRSREDTALAVESTLLEAVHGGYIAVAQSSLDRAVQRATYVATAAGVIVTLYTTILGLRFSNSSHPAFPARGLIPALFIGGAVAFSTWYMAFLRGTTKWTELLPSGLGGSIAETRLMDFMEWTFAGVLARAWSLRLSVISLALGLAFLPIGFVTLNTGVTLGLGVAGAAILLLWVVGEIYVAVMGPPFRSRDARGRRPRGARRPKPGEAHREAGVAEDREAGVAKDREAGVAKDREAGVAENREAGVAENREAGVAENREARHRAAWRRSVKPRPPKLAFEAKRLPKISGPIWVLAVREVRCRRCECSDRGSAGARRAGGDSDNRPEPAEVANRGGPPKLPQGPIRGSSARAARGRPRGPAEAPEAGRLG